jgi:hypothetical protein
MNESANTSGCAFHRLRGSLVMKKSLSMANLMRNGALACALAVLATVCMATSLSAQSAKDQEKPANPSGSAMLRVELTGGDAKKPIVDASVYVKYTEGKLLRDRKIEFNLKTNQNGVARSPQIPKGRVLIQIVSPGWKTFGKYYDLDQDEQTIQINLERPNTRWLQQ